MIKGHGGNVQALAERQGCTVNDIIDMSSNINPLGPPEGLEEFITENIHLIRALPQPDASDMVDAFSRYYGVPADRVIGANGTTWFIYTLPAALKSKKVLIAGPTYSDYRDGCIMNGVDFEFCMAEEKSLFQPDIEKLCRMAADADTVIICNPNNPTGALIPKNQILELIRHHKDKYFVIDESYLPFLQDAEEISLVAEKSYPNLIVLSSMSKIFRIPGLRTGYLCADPSVVEKMMRFYQPWSVNALSQAAIINILGHPEKIEPFLKTTRNFVQEEKALFEAAIEKANKEMVNKAVNKGSEGEAGAPKLKLYPAHTYFMLASISGSMKSDGLCRIVGDHRILIRDCSNFQGLSNRFVRFSLRDRETNMLLAEILKNALS